ncbi:hypothetical protein [Streptomyces sp. NBC_00872]|uniref:hypothetical protein n=1 Tax=Streptomyces sp. NBC_00872 TaxID=2903686 RepID=UPI00386BFABF|nr:hypothetical protein OG214_36185 [Streptomyces sp. NBC_00872]
MQSAITAVLATVGAALARAQYAQTVRPVLGYTGRAVAGLAPNDQLAWACHLLNGAQDVAVTSEVSYWVVFTPAALSDSASDSTHWGTSQEAIASMETRGLVHREDFELNFIGQGRPIPAQGNLFLGWLTEKAMREVENVFVKVHVVDRVGDTHERVVNLLRGANRTPRHPDAPRF